MSAEQKQGTAHEAASHAAPMAGDIAMKKVVIRNHDGARISSLDTNHDSIIGMQEMNPPRPENGQDFAVAGLAAAAMAVATVAAVGIQRFRTRH